MSQIKAWEPQADDRGSFADEAALVTGLRAGRQDAFEVLHGAYAASIYGLALRIVDDQHEAQDVAQEVLIKVFRGLPGDETDLNLPAWLYRVTVNAAFDHVRARKRRPVTVFDDAAPEPVAAVDEFERAELGRRVESTLHELPKRQQVALVLRDVHGLSVGETASVLGLTKGSADVLLSRARVGFRRVFLAGAGSLRGRCDMADKALAAGVGRGERVPTDLLEHSKTCPDCRRAVNLWGAAPIGLGLLLPQVVLPAKLSLGATLAAAQAAGVVVSVAGSGAAAVAPAAAGAAGTAAVAGGAATGGTAAVSAGGAGILAALGSAAGVKIATLAVVATAAVGITGAASLRGNAGRGPSGTLTAAQAQGYHGAGAGPSADCLAEHVRAQARQFKQANRRALSTHDGVGRPTADGRGSAASRSEPGGESASQGGSGGSAVGGSSGAQSSGQAVSRPASTGAGAGSAGGSGSGSGGAGGQSGGSGGATGGSSGGATGGSAGGATGGSAGGPGGGGGKLSSD